MQSTCPGLCLYTVRHAMQKDLTDTFQLLAAVGYRGVELFGHRLTHDLSRLRAAMQLSELTPVSWQVPWQEAADEALPESLLSCGCRTAVISTLFVSHTLPSRDEWFAQIDEINSLADRFARDGLRLGCHTSAFTFAPCDQRATYFEFLLSRLAPGVLIELDTGNCYQGGMDPCEAIRLCGKRPRYLHMKPYSPNKRFNVVLGEKEDASGWTSILAADADHAEQWLIEGACNSLQEMHVACLSLDNWRRFLAQNLQRPASPLPAFSGKASVPAFHDSLSSL